MITTPSTTGSTPAASAGTEPKFTPRPWHVDGSGRDAMVRGADLTIVAVRHRLPAPINDANMRLLAAAPEMFAALDALLNNPAFELSNPKMEDTGRGTEISRSAALDAWDAAVELGRRALALAAEREARDAGRDGSDSAAAGGVAA